MIPEASAFLTRISKLRGAEKSALKHSAGKPLREATTMALSAFYRCLPRDIPKWQEDRWFAIACFRCLWENQAADIIPLEKVIGGMIASEDLSESTKHRVESLLDTEWAEDNYMLTKLARLMKMIRHKTSSELPIDFAALLNDLIYWNNSKQNVQRKWAREIFALMAIEEDEAEN